MSDEMVVRQCAPTLAGLKTGSLFRCPYESKEQLASEVRRLNGIFVPKGLCLLPLHFGETHVLLYLYRPTRLHRDLQDNLANELLTQAGYSCGSCGRGVARLSRRLCECNEFPHEVGLFLSYPPEDVKGFIDNGAENYKLAGMWKVYGDEARARKLFAQFKKCTDIYCELWRAGSGLEQLAVAV